MYAVSILSAVSFPLVSELILFREDAPLSAVSRAEMVHGHAKYFCVASLHLVEQMSLICRKNLLVTSSRTRTCWKIVSHEPSSPFLIPVHPQARSWNAMPTRAAMS